MTYKDLLDALVRDSGDEGTKYRTNAVRWLNLVRQDAAVRGSWRSAKNSAITVTTAASNTAGIYELTGIDEVIGSEFYDQTNNNVVHHDTENALMRSALPSDQTGPPTLWADAGITVLGEKKVRFWPIPNGAFVLAYLGTKALLDVTTENENETIDPFFGPLSGCGSMLQAGLRYYHDLNNNEDVGMVSRSQGTFYKMIALVSGVSGVDANADTRLDPVNRRGYVIPGGRFDPGHYGNR